MAEAAVTFALGEIRDLLVAEGRLLSGVSGEVKALETQLREIKCLLEEADRRRHENKIIFNWLVEIRDLAYRAEAAIEVHAARVSSSRRRRGLRQLVRRYSSNIMKECYTRHQLGSDISQIKSELERVTSSMRDYGIRSIIGESSATQNWSKKSYPDFEIGDCFVGMKEELKKLDSLLVEDKEIRVISVFGMGGAGKTTIARKVYNQLKQTKNGCFDSFAWVCITQQCQIRSVLEDVLRQLESGKRKDVVSSLRDTELMERLCELQRDKRCLIVVDDLWEISHWDGFKHAFLVQDLQSKILVTTREQKVAEIGFPLKLGLLNTNDAWELLKTKAFPSTNIPDFAFEENLEKIGKEMVRKCGHLPLAISLLGGVLRKKNSMVEWELVNKNINTLMYRDEKEIDGVLNLSYENLPFNLKPCFLYMGMFEEDEEIYVNDLYRMWIAQGMISYENIGDKEKTSMDIAELYLSELASRSIVQVEILDDAADAGKYLTCKLHDVIRELCLKMGKKEDFGLQILKYQGRTFLPEASSHSIRYLRIHFTGEVEQEHDELTITRGEDTSKHLRSFQILSHANSNAIEFPPHSIVDFRKFKLLRDLVIVKFKFARGKLPRGITNLIHLRCLRVRDCQFDGLPSSIRNLVYLETLDLYWSKNVRVPNVLKEMFRLKHLILPPYDDEEIIAKYRFRLDEGVDELESLEWLDSRVHELKSSMGRMKKLRRFRATIFDNESLSGIMNAIATNWNKLAYSAVSICEGCELDGGLSEEAGLLKKELFTFPNLHWLNIENVKLGKVVAECGMSELLSSNLTDLSLFECEIEEDPMGILGNLPCLTLLCLNTRSFVGEEMTCPLPSFPRLKWLQLVGLPKLREWRVEAGAMPCLSELTIWCCDHLEMIPDGLSGIFALQKLTIGREMAELAERVSSPSGLDFHKVSRIPSIIID